MDLEVFPRPCKFVIGCWTSPGTTSVYTKEQNVRVTMKFKVPKRPTMYPLLWSNGFCRRGKKGAMVEKGKGPWQYIIIIMNFKWIVFRGKERWRQEKTREWSNLIFFSSKLLFWDIYAHIHFWCMVIPLGSTFSFTPSEGPKGFVNWFKKKTKPWKLDIKSDHGKTLSSMVWLHGPRCEQALNEEMLETKEENDTCAKWYANHTRAPAKAQPTPPLRWPPWLAG